MSKSNIVAVIDVGSNSIKLLVAQKGSDGRSLEKLFSKTLEVRISTGIGKQNLKLTKHAIRVGSQSIAVLVHLAEGYNPTSIKIVATSAVRDATNGVEFIEHVKQATNVPLDVLSGIEEATLIVKGLRCDPSIAMMKRFVHMDIGGGSLELVRFHQNSIEKACSLQLGAVRLTEKFVLDSTQMIDAETEANIRNYVLTTVTDSGYRFEPVTDPMIVTGGAFSVIRSILAAQSGKKMEDTLPILHKDAIAELKKTLCGLSLDERKNIPGLPMERADVIPAALITIHTILELSGREIITQSSYNLRYGIAAELLETDPEPSI